MWFAGLVDIINGMVITREHATFHNTVKTYCGMFAPLDSTVPTVCAEKARKLRRAAERSRLGLS